MTAPLLDRLRSMYSHRGDGVPTQQVNPDGWEAAALIEELVEGLRPFADCVAHLKHEDGDPEERERFAAEWRARTLIAKVKGEGDA